MYQYYIASKNEKISIPVVGIVRNKEEVILISFLRGKENKSQIRELISKTKKNQLRRIRNGFSETVTTLNIVSGKLNFLKSTKVFNFSNADIVTYANMELLQKTIFFSGSEEKKDLETSILKLLDDQSPIPIPKEGNVKSNISNSLMELSDKLSIEYSTDSFPYKNAVLIDVNSGEAIDRITKSIVISYGEQQFIEAFKRAPQVKSLMYMVDPKGSFSMKTWPKVMSHFGGRDMFEKMPYNYQKSIIWAYEVFGEKTNSIYNHMERVGVAKDFLPWKELAVSKAKIGKDFKINSDQFLKAFKYFDNGIMLFALVASLEDSKFRNDFPELSKNKNKLLSRIAINQYKGLKPGGEPIALVAAELLLSEDHFLRYQEEYITAMDKIINSSRTYPTISGTLEGTDYSWESMDMGNPRGWFVGLETNCCQHLYSVGSDCVMYAAQNPKYSGMLRIMKKGKTIAQSFFWFHQESGDFVLDNIEVLGNEIRKSILDCYNLFADELAARKDLFGYKRLLFGGGYSDINTADFQKVSDNVTLADMPNGQGVYSDAKNQYLLREF